jgi:hypothetical protein
VLRDSIDDVDALIGELTDLRQRLSQADLALASSGAPTGDSRAEDALWDAENRLRGVAERAAWRAGMVRRAIELFGEAPTA